MKEKAPRNRTITLSEEEYANYANKILHINAQTVEIKDILNKTICADLFTILSHLPAKFADLIILDPPYNLSKDFDGFRFSATSHVQYLKYLRSWLPQVVHCLKPNGSLYLCGDWKCTAALQEVLSENLTILNRISWQREKGRGAAQNWKNCCEDIWFAVKNPKNYFFNVEAVKLKRQVLAPYKNNGVPKDWIDDNDGKIRLTYPSNFWDDISVPFWSMPENTEHPTQKPEKLIAKLILASSKEGDIIFDAFLGSGTTSVVAKKLGRQYVGIEMNERYCCLCEKRLELAKTDKRIQGYEDGVFWERNSRHNSKKI